jgi:CRISPR-associated protein Cas1
MRKSIYILETGTSIRIRNDNLEVKRKDQKIVTVPLINIKRVYLKGNPFISAHSLLKLLGQEIDIVFLSFNGNFLTKIPSLPGKNIELRRKQYQLFEMDEYRSQLAVEFIKGKIWNSYILMKRYLEKHQNSNSLNRMLLIYDQLKLNNHNIDSLMGKEGAASQAYFSAFGKNTTENQGDAFDFLGFTHFNDRDVDGSYRVGKIAMKIDKIA